MHKRQLLSDSDLLADWQRIAAGRRHQQRNLLTRTIGALGYLTHGPQPEKYVEIDKLILVALYDDPNHPSALHLAGYAARRVPHGVQWGGPDGRRFHKNLSLVPKHGASGRRIDLTNDRMLHLGLRLEQRRQRAASYGLRGDAVSPKLPRLWAAFRDWNASWLQGEGPEFAKTQNRFGYESQRLLEYFRRKHFGLTLLPFDWVSHELDRAVTIFAELDGFPRRQAFRLNELPGSLTGYQGAVAFDFHNGCRRTRSHSSATAA